MLSHLLTLYTLNTLRKPIKYPENTLTLLLFDTNLFMESTWCLEQMTHGMVFVKVAGGQSLLCWVCCCPPPLVSLHLVLRHTV